MKMRCTICDRNGYREVWVPVDGIVDHLEMHHHDEPLLRWPDGKIVTIECDLEPHHFSEGTPA